MSKMRPGDFRFTGAHFFEQNALNNGAHRSIDLLFVSCESK